MDNTTKAESRSVEPATVEERLAALIGDVFRDKRWMVVDPDKMPLPPPDESWFTAIGKALGPAILAAAKEHGLVIGEGELDRAWKEAEEALPEGWAIEHLSRGVFENGEWWTRAWSVRGGRSLVEHGPTPTAALQALTAKLLESRR